MSFVRWALTACTWVAAAAACRPAAPAPEPSAASAPATSAAPSALSSTAPIAPSPRAEDRALPADLRAAFEGSGVIQRSVYIPASDVWLVILGSPEVGRAAYSVSSQHGQLPVEMWPVGVRVLEAVAHANDLYVLVESAGVLDQPKGMRGVVRVTERGGALRVFAFPLDSVGVFDRETLGGAVTRAARRSDLSVELRALLSGASQSAAALGGALAPRGADVYEVWQQSLLHHVGHFDAASPPPPERATALLSVIRSLLDHGAHCDVAGCDDWRWGSGVALTDGRISGIFGVPSAEAAARSAPARGRLPSASPSEAMSAAVRELTPGETTVLEIALDDTTVALVEATDAGTTQRHVVLRKGDFAAARGLPIEGAPQPAAFLDLRGDGSLALLYGPSTVVDFPVPTVAAYPVVWSSADLFSPYRLGYDFALRGKKTFDEAVAALLAAPRDPVARDEACSLLDTLKTWKDLRAVATPDAYFLHYQEPGQLLTHSEVVAFGRLAGPDFQSIASSCARSGDYGLECAGAVCSGTLGNAYWFERTGGALHVRAIAFYTGS